MTVAFSNFIMQAEVLPGSPRPATQFGVKTREGLA